jgi:uncharacterized ferredoxin-like protein
MASDATVTPRLILDAVHELERRGAQDVLRTLEQVEPELLNYVMERLSALHGRLIALGGPPRRTARALRHAEATILVCIGAMRAAHLAEWCQAMSGSALEHLDSAEEPSEASGPADAPDEEDQSNGGE